MHLKVVASNGEFLVPHVPVVVLSSRGKAQYAFKRAGLFLLFALFSVFVPVFHFVLVPLFLIVAFVFGMKARKARFMVEAFDTKCPHCQAPLKSEALYLEDELRQFCINCRDQLKFEVEA